MILNNRDLMYNRNKYDEKTLLENIDRLSIKTILNTQKLSEEFCATYIYCVSDIDDGDEESYLFSSAHILNKQSHLDEDKFLRLVGEK